MPLKQKLFKQSSLLKEEISKFSKTTRHFKHQNIASADIFNPNLPKALSSDSLLKMPISNWHAVIVLAIGLLALPLLAIRLFHLSIVQGSYMRSLADSNRIVVKVIHAPRGVIYDRNGQILAQNEPGFRLVDATHSSGTKYLTRDEALKLEVDNDPKLKDLEIDNLRSYPHKESTAHLLGYISEITEEELKQDKYRNYLPGDRIGRAGVEEHYEAILRGIDGGEIIEVDASGNKLRTLGKTEPIPGQNIKLSINLGLQKVSYNALLDTAKKVKTCCGGAVVTDVQNGQVLALASIPSFDPNNISKYFQDPTSPLLNRVISGTYPPGSTFKIATAISGLESGKITPDTKVYDTGVYLIGPYSFANWYFTQYGAKEKDPLDVISAIKRSNDIFFYHLGELTGEKIMGEWAKKLGFGQLSGIDLPEEQTGLIPDNEWKVNYLNEVWFPGDSLHMAIGQGFVLTTPIQVHQMLSTIATNDKTYPPRLGYQVVTSDFKVIKEFKFGPTTVGINQHYLSLVKTGLSLVTKSGGTAWPFFAFPIQSAGKTGTAEFGHPQNKTHAWYTGFAPDNDPQIAATVLIEGGGEGSSIAAPVVKEIFRYYFSPDKSSLIKDIYIPSSPSATLSE